MSDVALTPDGVRYLKRTNLPAPFHLRWLIPWLCRDESTRWNIAAWAGFAALELHRMRQSGGVPLHPGWWGFVFPVAALSLSCGALADQLASAPVDAASFVIFVCLVIAWAIVAWRSSAAVLRALRPA